MAREATTLRISERDFTDLVIAYAKAHSWRVCHFRPARTEKGWRTALQGDPGWPDCMFAKGGRLVLAELKSDKGKLDDEQMAWRTEIGFGAEFYVWRPSDWSRIETVLA